MHKLRKMHFSLKAFNQIFFFKKLFFELVSKMYEMLMRNFVHPKLCSRSVSYSTKYHPNSNTNSIPKEFVSK